MAASLVLNPEGLKVMNLVPLTPLYEAGFDMAKPKEWTTSDGGGFTFTLLRHKKEVAYVENSGTGGGAWVQWGMGNKASKAFVDEARAEFDRVVAEMPQILVFETLLTVSADIVVEEMLQMHQICKKLAKGKAILANPADEGRTYATFSGALDDNLRASIAKNPKWSKHVLLNDLVTHPDQPSPKVAPKAAPKVLPSRRKLDELLAREGV